MIEVISIALMIFIPCVLLTPVLIYGLIWLLPEYKGDDTDD